MRALALCVLAGLNWLPSVQPAVIGMDGSGMPSRTPIPLPTYAKGDPREGEPIQPILARAVSDPVVVEAATWAVNELRAMSDSGIYETLRLVEIREAASQVGVFHDNLLLTVDLESPHLLDGIPVTTHRIVVMKDQEDGVRSFAIDDFPVMDPDAVETFWRRKVDAHKAAREKELDRLEAEYEAYAASLCSNKDGVEGNTAAVGVDAGSGAAFPV